tara:strand:+ start:97 stop:1218 length:1122 start_codon:yes stop_codon:yes gene_type:complete
VKISLLSVAPPYRGGISDQTHLLYKTLKKHHSVNIINFKRQYPEMLFPGKSQYHDPYDWDEKYNHRLLDSINPISWLSVVKFIKSYAPDLIIIRFWNPFFAISYSYILKKIKKHFKSIKVICVCDNIIPHEKHFFDKLLISKIFKQIDGFVVMSDQVKEELLDLRPDANYIKVFHPILNDISIKDKTRSKSKLGLSGKKIILFFGLVRKYKGLEVLIKSNKYLMNKLKDYQILICGESYADTKFYNKMINHYSISNEIKWINEFIPDDEVATYFSASDIVVLPYLSASQSGIIPLAYSYQKPVVASDIKGIKEMILDGKTGYLFEKNNSKMLSEKIEKFFTIKRDYSLDIEKFREYFSWDEFSAKIQLLYKSL